MTIALKLLALHLKLGKLEERIGKLDKALRVFLEESYDNHHARAVAKDILDGEETA